MSKKKKPLDDFVIGRAPVQLNQTSAGPMKDKRTKRERDRSTKERNAIEKSANDE
jgi:hypothetical protein